MSKRILIILGHPALERQSFCEALASAYHLSAERAGHEVRLIHVAKLSFDPILHEGNARPQTLEADLLDAQGHVLWANHLVIVYPMWAYMIPALLKGFFERTFTPGFAYQVKGKNPFDAGLLGGKSARIIQTSGMPGFFYRLMYCAHGAKALRSMLHICGIKPVRFSYFGAFEDDVARRAKLIAKAGALGGAGA